MNRKIFWLSIIAVIASFAGGFLLANALNRNVLNDLRGENERLRQAQSEPAGNQTGATLSEQEIREKIAAADANPNDFNFQKNLGLALYQYAAMRQDAALLAEVGRLLQRAFENDRRDYNVLTTLGNIRFDIGYLKKDDEQFRQARALYEAALEQKPNDIDVRTDLGLTYFLIESPDYERAVAELQKSLKTNPQHEKTLQAMTQILIAQNNRPEAEKYLAKLRETNAGNQFLPELERRAAQIGTEAQQQ